MALGFKEKRTLQTTITQKQADIEAGTLGFSAKRASQKELEDAFAKLNEQIDIQPEVAQQNQQLADLIAGKFNDEEPDRFLHILKNITDEIQAVEPVKEPTIKYIEIKKANPGESPPIMEAAADIAAVDVAEENNADKDDIVLESSQLAKDVAAYRDASTADRDKMLPGIRRGIRGLAITDDPDKDTILKAWAEINATEI